MEVSGWRPIAADDRLADKDFAMTSDYFSIEYSKGL